eukprot:TRINITY_DN2630_c1_g1_i1.p1 TRINITY_DN2630_c1_g1~~TRINITY_DN2630_c1_g1_i1.p1  ORF type:complete len:228 (+),score=58.21 TRINITY_DN2630_c1_g1_i1:98-781(+)
MQLYALIHIFLFLNLSGTSASQPNLRPAPGTRAYKEESLLKSLLNCPLCKGKEVVACYRNCRDNDKGSWKGCLMKCMVGNDMLRDMFLSMLPDDETEESKKKDAAVQKEADADLAEKMSAQKDRLLERGKLLQAQIIRELEKKMEQANKDEQKAVSAEDKEKLHLVQQQFESIHNNLEQLNPDLTDEDSHRSAQEQFQAIRDQFVKLRTKYIGHLGDKAGDLLIDDL